MYQGWLRSLPPQLELRAAQLPGREARFGEPLLDELAPMVDALEVEIARLADRPLALFGHSMGALIAFELARRLERAGAPRLVALFVSGRRAPHLPEREPLHALPERDFIAALRRMGGTPDEIFAAPELLSLLLPIIRADLAAVETDPRAEGEPLSCPLVAFGGTSDARTDLSALDGWRRWSPRARIIAHQGGHFFIESAREKAIAEIARTMDAELETQ